MIISASRRTDLPAFFGDWFINRLRAGFCKARNPFNPQQVSRLELTPEAVDAFVFWTRDPRPFSHALDELDSRRYPYVFLVTITGYPRELETATPDLETATNAVRELARRIGRERIAWRYDPILISNRTDASWHLENLRRLGERIAPHVDHAIISLTDFYRKTGRHLKKLEESGWVFQREPENEPAFAGFVQKVADIGDRCQLRLQTCCESSPVFEQSGILHGACIDTSWLNRALWLHLDTGRRDRGQRPNCACAPSKDLGSSNTCRHGCLYCYATRSHDSTQQPQHDPDSEFLS